MLHNQKTNSLGKRRRNKITPLLTEPRADPFNRTFSSRKHWTDAFVAGRRLARTVISAICRIAIPA
jgi:hypothetical protein